MSLRSRVEALEHRLGVMRDRGCVIEHGRCLVCGIWHHRPNMAFVPGEWASRWICVFCLPGSEYDRRKGERTKGEEPRREGSNEP